MKKRKKKRSKKYIIIRRDVGISDKTFNHQHNDDERKFE